METSASFEARSAPLPYPTTGMLVFPARGGRIQWEVLLRAESGSRRLYGTTECATPGSLRFRNFSRKLACLSSFTVPSSARLYAGTEIAFVLDLCFLTALPISA